MPFPPIVVFFKAKYTSESVQRLRTSIRIPLLRFERKPEVLHIPPTNLVK